MNNSDLIALCAMIVAVLSLFATAWQAHLSHRHNKLSVRPRLDWTGCYTQGGPIYIEIVNHGLGPEIIDFYQFEAGGICHLVDDEDLPQSIEEKFLAKPFSLEWATITPGTPLPAGSAYKLFTCLVDPKDASQYREACSFLQSVRFTIKYKSIYDESFTATRSRDV